jgi:hypothetical protein
MSLLLAFISSGTLLIVSAACAGLSIAVGVASYLAESARRRRIDAASRSRPGTVSRFTVGPPMAARSVRRRSGMSTPAGVEWRRVGA